MTLLFTIAIRHSLWRVTLNGLFFGDYRSVKQANQAIAEAREVFAPRSAEAKPNDIGVELSH